MKPYFNTCATAPSSGRKIWLVVHGETLEAHPEAREFSLYLASEKAVNTSRRYIQSVTFFLNWAQDFGTDWKTITLARMIRFKWMLETEQVNTRNGLRDGRTVNAILTHVLEFLRYSARAGLMSPKVLERLAEPRWLSHLPDGFDPGEAGQLRAQRARLLKVREVQRRPDVLTDEQLEIVFRLCRTARDRFQITLMLDTGIRVGEALGLRRSDMHLLPDSLALGCNVAGAHLHVEPRTDNANGASVKSGVARHVPVPASTVEAYVHYQAERDSVPEASGSDYVFVNLYGGERGAPMTYSATKKVFDRISKSGGFSLRPHMLRHTAATRWIQTGGASRDTVQKLLGHRSASSTSVYLHPSDDTLRAAVEQTAAALKRRTL